MIKTILVDDEINARNLLEKLLERYFPDKFLILAKCESVDDALIAIEKFNPELIFLDIQMPQKNGFQLLKEVKTINFEVIFTTAYAEFAIDAIRSSALDYLLKPISYVDLASTIKKYDEKANKASEQQKLMLLIENLDTGSSIYNKIALPVEYGFEIIKINSILYCEADNNYCKVYCLDGKRIVLSKTLKYIEDLLPNTIFHRIHKSFLVNLNYITRFDKTNELKIELTNGQILPVSIRQKEEFLNAIIQRN